ncbi:MAG: hypothetical protein Q8L14_21745 [Myxococcales bacterium]|nr:hypothetical protein [Myxococcales bacterium]
MTDNGELQQRKHESNEVHLERLKGILRERRAQAQAELELKRHLEDSIRVMTASGASAAARNELHRELGRVCLRLGTARGQVDIAESYLVLALNR